MAFTEIRTPGEGASNETELETWSSIAADVWGESTDECASSPTDQTEETDATGSDASDEQMLEDWGETLDAVGMPEGPYRDLYMELGRQLISGELDPEKLQEAMLSEAVPGYEESLAALKAGMKINKFLRDSGITIHIGPGGRDVSVSERARAGEWTFSLSVDSEAELSSEKRKFLDPEAPGFEALRHDKGEATADEAFQILRRRFSQALA